MTANIETLAPLWVIELFIGIDQASLKERGLCEHIIDEITCYDIADIALKCSDLIGGKQSNHNRTIH